MGRGFTFAGSLLNICNARSGLVDARSEAGLLHEWQGPKSLSHYLLSPRTHNSRKLELEEEIGLNRRQSDMEGGVSQSILMMWGKRLSPSVVLM